VIGIVLIAAVAAVLAWWLSPRVRPKGLRLAMGVAVGALVAITGHYGGNLMHGATYWVEYAPAPLRALFSSGGQHTESMTVAVADPYEDIVAPLLELRCGGCHNDDEITGGFSVSNYDFTLVGGDTARAVVPGDLLASELFYRITLPATDDTFMPAEGKTPLTPAQVEILRWWISAGAPRNTTVAALSPDGEIMSLLAAEFDRRANN